MGITAGSTVAPAVVRRSANVLGNEDPGGSCDPPG